MKRSIVFLVAAVLLLAGVGIVVSRSERGTSAQGSARVLLNEILFQPAVGESGFVELANMGAEPATLDGFALVNQAGERYTVPAGTTLPAGGVLLVRPQTGFLQRETGSLALLSGADTIDEALWSTAGGPSFNLGRGGHIPTFVPGTTLGRPRGSTGHGPVAWTVFDPTDVTPGAANAFPTVTGMMPLSGAMLRTATPTLSWYSVPAATRYRVQVATTREFGSPVFDHIAPASGHGLTIERMTPTALPPGRYVWRVQAIFGERDAPTTLSAPALLWVEGASVASTFISRLFPTVLAAPAAVGKALPVPLILQKRDTRLLLIGAGGVDEGGNRPWDRPWEPAPAGPFCARASVAMVTAYFHGNLSQDRISYEAGKDTIGGPMFDINAWDGLEDPAIERVLKFALGAPPIKRTFDGSEDVATYFAAHQAAINGGSPVVASTRTHAFVVVGWGEDERGKYLTINDPGVGQYDWLVVPAAGFAGVDDDIIGANTQTRSTSFFLPRDGQGKSDEPEIDLDSDGDEVRDFDEIKRFGTNPLARDTDGDGVNDKAEIRAWMFDEKYGASATGYVYPFQHADRDRDNLSMEVDPDSDNGGCLDGMEDTNGNGKHEPGQAEFYNFDKDDDACLFGSYVYLQDSVFTNPDGSTQKLDQHHFIQFSFREIDGAQQGRATMTASYRQRLTDPNDNGCGNRSDSTEPYQYGVDVQAILAPMPDGTVWVTVKAPIGWTPPTMRHVSTCPGSPPFEAPGPEPAVGGPLRDGVFDEHVDMALDREGGTGKKYYETHIRQSQRR